VYEFVCDDDA